MSKPTIGFVGLGAMGFGMATHLVKQGYPVHGYDVFPASVQRFESAGGIPAGSLKESAQGKAFYVCMVASAAQAEVALFGEDGVVQHLPQNATLLLTSTVPASYAQSVSAKLQQLSRDDIHFVDAPVSGGTSRAANGTLSIMAGGADTAIQSANDLLRTLSDADACKLYLVPGGVGAGSNMKMLHQVLASVHILGVSEGMGFAANLGLEADDTAKKIRESEEGWTWMLSDRFPRMLAEDWNPGASALTIILKDAGIITTTARQSHFPTPLSSTAEQVYLTALSQGYASKDDSSMIRQYFAQPVASVTPSAATDQSAALQLVIDLMSGINLVAAAEAVAFTRHLGIDFDMFYDLASNAAGASGAFNGKAREMNAFFSGADVTGARVATLDEAIARLEAVVQKAWDLHVPLHLGNAALNLLLLAKRKGYGEGPSAGVVRVFS